MDKIKLCLTGSAGFIIGNLVRKLVYLSNKEPEKYPYSIISIDNINNGDVNSIYWNKSHTFYIADIRDQHIIDTIFKFEKPDIVIHGAAMTHVDESLKDPNLFVTSNVLGTQTIINASIKNEIKKLIYISSDEIYGHLENKLEPSWTEESVPNPRNPYAASKLAGEMLIKAANTAHGLIYNITRSSNNYGPRQTPDKLIPKAIKCIMEGTKIPIYGEGQQIRDWTHVFDNCSAILTVLKHGKENEIYNIASSQEYSNTDVINEICRVMESKDIINYIKDPRNGHDFRYSLNCSKIEKLGWKPQFKFKEGITQCVNWYQLNRWFIK